ncbi:YggS family pyridoxal phosphate-dependent enzyme [Populibacterium corticicola]|uniref:Pyridoxal phosphate homeostasis protein n=1 Tax=Populibacterium corticicola TaxID=1812826 RepID=A0ABW5XF36_9MICO
MSNELFPTRTTSSNSDDAGGRVYRRQYEPAITVADFTLNRQVVQQNIARAAQRAGRNSEGVRLLAVSKTVSHDRVRNAHVAGLNQFAENKVQEAHAKAHDLADLDARWVMIGHLQTNKAKQVAEFAHEFQGLDSARIAAALDRRLQQLGRSLDVLVQVNVSGEATKSGVEPSEVEVLLGELKHCDALRVRGFMTIASHTTDEQQVRNCFRDLRDIRDQAQQTVEHPELFTELSMGMSGDYEIAIEEGSTVVRVGSALFGSRYYPA